MTGLGLPPNEISPIARLGGPSRAPDADARSVGLRTELDSEFPMTDISLNFTNHFLIAMPGLTDPYFAKTVTYLCQHNDEGALGIIVNRPSELKLKEIFDQMDIEPVDPVIAQTPVYFGGPVQPERGFVLHDTSGPWESTLRIGDTLLLTTSRDILVAMGKGEGPPRALVSLGYAGWSPGQLEREIAENSWLNATADKSIIFEQPVANRWKAAAELMGIDISLLTVPAGHA